MNDVSHPRNRSPFKKESNIIGSPLESIDLAKSYLTVSYFNRKKKGKKDKRPKVDFVECGMHSHLREELLR